MKIFLIVLGGFVANVLSNPCETFNMKYEFCYENWLPKKMIESLANALDESEIRTNLNLRMETIHDSSIFIFETKNSEIVEAVSGLPSELRKEGMIELLGQTYGPYLALVSAGYFGDQQQKGILAKDSIGVKVSRSQFRFNLLANKGKLAKSYDITKYGIYYIVKLVKGIKGDDSDEEEDEAEE